MIKIEVEEYCHSCEGFEADVIGPVSEINLDGEYFVGDTIVRCSNHKRCRNITRYLERQVERQSRKENNDV